MGRQCFISHFVGVFEGGRGGDKIHYITLLRVLHYSNLAASWHFWTYTMVMNRYIFSYSITKKPETLTICACCTLGWSDWALFYNFWKSYKFLLIMYIFRRSIPKNQQITPQAPASHVRQSFHIQKIAGVLNMNIVLWKFVESFFKNL